MNKISAERYSSNIDKSLSIKDNVEEGMRNS